MDYINARVILTGTAALSHSHQHAEPWLEGESHDAYDSRTWRSKLNIEGCDWAYPYPEQTTGTVMIPAMAIQRGMVEGAKFSKKKIPGEGKSTWTKRFESGISVITNGILNVDPATVKCVVLSMNADGVRGSGKRVTRRLPQIPPGWEAEFDVMVLDPMIIEDVFVEMLEYAGLFVGVGQFRPQNGGNNGRFVLKSIDWQDNRRMVRRRPLAA